MLREWTYTASSTRPSRLPSGNLSGLWVQNPCPWEISRASGDVFPIHPSSCQCTDTIPYRTIPLNTMRYHATAALHIALPTSLEVLLLPYFFHQIFIACTKITYIQVVEGWISMPTVPINSRSVAMVGVNTSADVTVTLIAYSDRSVMSKTTNASLVPTSLCSTPSRSTQPPVLDALRQQKVWL